MRSSSPLPLSLLAHKCTMTDHFPQLLKDAATKWGNETTGFAQFREQVDGNTIRIKLRLQATDIMTEFVGEVHFGRGNPTMSSTWYFVCWLLSDPKGILFYHRQSDFKVEDADYQVFYHRGPGHSVAVRVDFYVTGENEAFARVRIVVWLLGFSCLNWPIVAPWSVPRKSRHLGMNFENLFYTPIHGNIEISTPTRERCEGHWEVETLHSRDVPDPYT